MRWQAAGTLRFLSMGRPCIRTAAICICPAQIKTDFYDLYRYQLDGNGFRRLAGGRIADCNAGGEGLYYLPGASGETGALAL